VLLATGILDNNAVAIVVAALFLPFLDAPTSFALKLRRSTRSMLMSSAPSTT